MERPLFEASDDAATPLSPEEPAQITPTYITTRAQLNEVEQWNITDADLWAFTTPESHPRLHVMRRVPHPD